MPSALKTAKIQFLGEQDGLPERELKRALMGCLASCGSQVAVAYLMRVSYVETPGVQIALCMRVEESDCAELMSCIGNVFRRLFGATQHMDILFLSEVQHEAIDKVAEAFYTASA